MVSVYKMSRSQLVEELESYPMEVIGNIHDLRESVKLGRAIIKMCQVLEVPVEPTPEVPEPEPTPEVPEPEEDTMVTVITKNLVRIKSEAKYSLFLMCPNKTWSIDWISDELYLMTDGVASHTGNIPELIKHIKVDTVSQVSLFDNEMEEETVIM